MATITLIDMPVDILVNIFKRLHIGEVFNLILTCKAFMNLIIHENSIWRSISQSRLIIHDCGYNKITSSRSWYNTCRISNNWCKGIYKSKSLINHRINYMPWIKFQREALLLTIGRELACYSVDKHGLPDCHTVHWQLTMPEIYRYDIRTDDISRFILKDNLLVCGNRNGSTAVYNVENIKSTPVLIQYIKDCHEDGQVEVSAVEIFNSKDNAYMVTASNDYRLVHFWSWDTNSESPDLSKGGDDFGTYMAIDLEDCKGAKCLAINESGDKLAIGPNGNSKPILIDVNTANFLISSKETKSRRQAVRDIQWHNSNTICYVTHSGVLQMIDIRSNESIYNVKDQFQSSFYCVKTDGCNTIITGTSEYSRCVLYDARKPLHVQLYFTQRKSSSPVYSLDFDSTKLIVALDRGSEKHYQKKYVLCNKHWNGVMRQHLHSTGTNWLQLEDPCVT